MNLTELDSSVCVLAVERSRVSLSSSESNSTGYINASYVMVRLSLLPLQQLCIRFVVYVGADSTAGIIVSIA